MIEKKAFIESFLPSFYSKELNLKERLISNDNSAKKMPDLKKTIKEKYAEALEKSKETKDTVCCTEGSAVKHKRPEKGIITEELVIPSLGCVFDLPSKANITPGDIIVDFGSGTGFDLIRAAKLTGEKGKAIGIDMTEEMIAQAKENLQKMAVTNAEVKLGEIEDVPLEDEMADIVISNCVINLAEDKEAVFREVYRILKPGGRLVDADKIAEEELPESLRNHPESWCGCVSGALTEEGYVTILKKVGFKEITVKIYDKSSFTWEGEELTLLNGLIEARKE